VLGLLPFDPRLANPVTAIWAVAGSSLAIVRIVTNIGRLAGWLRIPRAMRVWLHCYVRSPVYWVAVVDLGRRIASSQRSIALAAKFISRGRHQLAR
jgi:hypothetical protein